MLRHRPEKSPVLKDGINVKIGIKQGSPQKLLPPAKEPKASLPPAKPTIAVLGAFHNPRAKYNISGTLTLPIFINHDELVYKLLNAFSACNIFKVDPKNKEAGTLDSIKELNKQLDAGKKIDGFVLSWGVPISNEFYKPQLSDQDVLELPNKTKKVDAKDVEKFFLLKDILKKVTFGVFPAGNFSKNKTSKMFNLYSHTGPNAITVGAKDPDGTIAKTSGQYADELVLGTYQLHPVIDKAKKIIEGFSFFTKSTSPDIDIQELDSFISNIAEHPREEVLANYAADNDFRQLAQEESSLKEAEKKCRGIVSVETYADVKKLSPEDTKALKEKGDYIAPAVKELYFRLDENQTMHLSSASSIKFIPLFGTSFSAPVKAAQIVAQENPWLEKK